MPWAIVGEAIVGTCGAFAAGTTIVTGPIIVRVIIAGAIVAGVNFAGAFDIGAIVAEQLSYLKQLSPGAYVGLPSYLDVLFISSVGQIDYIMILSLQLISNSGNEIAFRDKLA